MTTICQWSAEALLPAATTNFPNLLRDAQMRYGLGFDATADEACLTPNFVAPQSLLTGTLYAIITYRMVSANTGTIVMQAVVEAITDGDTVDTDAGSSFDSVNNSGAVAVPGTAGYIDQIILPLAAKDSIAAGDLCRLKINRDADSTTATDNAAGDLEILHIELRDS